jgi:ATP-binding cassette subfamily B protein RaxB
VTTQFVGTVLDGLLSIFTLALLFVYRAPLAIFVLAMFAVYAAARLAFFPRLREASEAVIVRKAQQQSELLETIRGIVAIVLNNQQAARRARYANSVVETVNREVSVEALNVAAATARQLCLGVGRVGLWWLAASSVLDGAFSAGMLVAFVAFAEQFNARAAALLDKVVEFRMLRLYGERLTDIVLTPPESAASPASAATPLDASVEFRDVSFRYSEDERWILHGVSFRVEAGECVAIAGPSGCGKTTVAKLMLGLLRPSAGAILVGGIDIAAIGMTRLRTFAAAVMQNDQLFAGSIADNIAFFAGDARFERVRECARLAGIDEDIERMPMGYESLVGDMGSALSGGQKQRLILARALYRDAQLLILDEATSHLDAARERQITREVARLAMTRIVIAHRVETLAGADRVIELPALGAAAVAAAHA